MLFVLLLSISHSIQVFDESSSIEPASVPISVGIDQMESSYSNCNTDFDCNTTIISPECGKKCWASSTSHYFQYTFKGEMFQVYASKQPNNGNFSILLDGNHIATIDSKLSPQVLRTLVYTSDLLPYDSHTIRVQGLNQNFEIYKFAYWPSVKAKRINSSELGSSGNWQIEPDKIGGTREWVNDVAATKQVSLFTSKVWVYGAKDHNYGYMNITFNDKTTSVNENGNPRVDGVLLYESDEFPYKTYSLSIKNGQIGSHTILSLYCIYYLDDPPVQTQAPFPSRSPVPGTADSYINKNFQDTIPADPIAASDTVKQVSGCTFTNVQASGFIIQSFQKKLTVFDNTFIYTEEMENPMVFFVRYDYSEFHEAFVITSCTFNNLRHLKRSGEGIIFSINVDAHVKFESCKFINIGKDSSQTFLKINGAGSHLEIIDSTFTLDDCERGCILCNFKLSDVLIDGCTFTRPPSNMINFLSGCTAGTFTFTNNIVEEGTKTFIMAPDMKNKPVISHNVFQNIQMQSGYLISYTHIVNEIELINNTFQHITGKSLYGGGIASWYQNKNNADCTIIYDQCKFIDVSNGNTESPSNQGGAIQYGHSTSIMNSIMIFRNCEFKQNKCLNGMGGALGININKDLTITGCLFEDNTASDKGGAIYIWGKLAKPADNNNAPDPPDSLQMNSITITNCQFIGNKGSNGHAIYVEEENIAAVTMTISDCTFTNNGETNSQFMIVNYCGNLEFENNSVEYTDTSKTSGALLSTNTNTATITDSVFTNCIVTATSTVHFVNQNANSVTTITNSEFVNCKANNFAVTMTGGTSNVDSCTISFDNAAEACGAIDFGNKAFTIQNSRIIKTNAEGAIKFVQTTTDAVTVNNCIFDSCIGSNIRCFSISVKTTDFTFSNNVIENMLESGNKGYFGSIDCNNALQNMVLRNITFRNNACNSDYGGGTGLWLTKTTTITFEKCNFINNFAKKSPFSRAQKPDDNAYFSGDGGGMQYGFSGSINNVNMVYDHCVFRENKAVRHGGALAIQTIQAVEIVDCLFENNIADYKSSNSEMLAINNYFNLKAEGRGGAIYLNPSFSYDNNDYKMKSAKIEGCTFIQNKAYDGYAIYIEGEDTGTTFVINQNTFIDNYNENTLSSEKSVISSEIYDLYEGKVVESNNFTLTNPDIIVKPLVYANHSGIPPQTPSASPIITGADMGTSSLLGNQNNIPFECPVDRGSIKVSLSCSTCTVTSGIYFIAYFEQQKITKVEFDPREIFNGETIQFFVKESVVYNEGNRSLSFNSGSKVILFEKDKTENNLKCYVPLSEIVIEDNDCSSNNRCEQIVEEPRPVHVFIEISKFNDFNKTTEDGGAIHLIDCCLTCEETPFTNCESKNGGGGAIYIKNDLDYTNNVTLSKIVFTECKAKYGGAVYIQCKSERVPVRVTECDFIKNTLIDPSSTSAKGSALFLKTRKSQVKRCKFIENSGGSSVLEFQSISNEGRAINLNENEIFDIFDSFSISESKFEVTKTSMSSLRFIPGNTKTHFIINKCIFIGDLADNAYHIEGQWNDVTKRQLSMKINACKFSTDYKRSLNLDPSQNVDLNDLVFDYSGDADIIERAAGVPWKVIAIIIASALIVVAIVFISLIVYLKKKKSGKVISDGNDNEYGNETFTLLNQNLI